MSERIGYVLMSAIVKVLCDLVTYTYRLLKRRKDSEWKVQVKIVRKLEKRNKDSSSRFIITNFQVRRPSRYLLVGFWFLIQAPHPPARAGNWNREES